MPPRSNNNNNRSNNGPSANMDVYSIDGLRCYTVPRCVISHSGLSAEQRGTTSSASASPTSPLATPNTPAATSPGTAANSSSNGPTVCRAHCEAVETNKGRTTTTVTTNPSGTNDSGVGCPMGTRCPNVHVDVPMSTLRSEAVHLHYIWRDESCVTYEKLTQPMTRDHTRMTREEVANTLLEVYGPNNREPFEMIPALKVLHTRGARYAFDAAVGSPNRTPSTSRPCHCAHYYFNQICNRGPSCAFIHVVSTDPKQKDPCVKASNYHRRIALLATGNATATANGAAADGEPTSNVSPNTPQTHTGGARNTTMTTTPTQGGRGATLVAGNNNSGNSPQTPHRNGTNNTTGTNNTDSSNSNGAAIIISNHTTPSMNGRSTNVNTNSTPACGGAIRNASNCVATPTTTTASINGSPTRSSAFGADLAPPPPPEAFIATNRSASNSPSLQMHQHFSSPNHHSPSGNNNGCVGNNNNYATTMQQQQQHYEGSSNFTTTTNGGNGNAADMATPPPPPPPRGGAFVGCDVVNANGNFPRVLVGGVPMPPTPGNVMNVASCGVNNTTTNYTNNNNNGGYNNGGNAAQFFPPEAPTMPFANINNTGARTNNSYPNTTTSSNNNGAMMLVGNNLTLPAGDMDYDDGFGGNGNGISSSHTNNGGKYTSNSGMSFGNNTTNHTTSSSNHYNSGGNFNTNTTNTKTITTNANNTSDPNNYWDNTTAFSNGRHTGTATVSTAAVVVTVGGQRLPPPTSEGCNSNVNSRQNSTQSFAQSFGTTSQQFNNNGNFNHTSNPPFNNGNTTTTTTTTANNNGPCGSSMLPLDEQTMRAGNSMRGSGVDGYMGSPTVTSHTNNPNQSPSMTPMSAKVPQGRFTHQPYTPPSTMHQYGNGIASATMSPSMAMQCGH